MDMWQPSGGWNEEQKLIIQIMDSIDQRTLESIPQWWTFLKEQIYYIGVPVLIPVACGLAVINWFFWSGGS
jgi:hypothetical protein